MPNNILPDILQYIFRALRDCSSVMRKVKHLDSAEEFRVENFYCNEIEDHFNQKVAKVYFKYGLPKFKELLHSYVQQEHEIIILKALGI